MSPNRRRAVLNLPQPADDLLEPARPEIVSSNGFHTSGGGEELGRALAELADRIDRTVEMVRELVQLVNPQGIPDDLRLTTRELEMLGYLAEGRSNAEIAKHCWVSENTVKFHLKNLFRKLGVRDRGQAMMMARAIHRRLT